MSGERLPNPGPSPVMLFGVDTASGSGTPVGSAEANSDANAATTEGIVTLAYNYGFNGATWDRIRIANVFNTVVATALGPTPVWTPGAGNFFRLMGYTISVSGTIAATGPVRIELLDVALIWFNHFATVASVTDTGDTQIGADLGQGRLSALAGDVLNVNLSVAFLTGGVAVNVWGTQGPTA
jgi:hypothetical protein